MSLPARGGGGLRGPRRRCQVEVPDLRVQQGLCNNRSQRQIPDACIASRAAAACPDGRCAPRHCAHPPCVLLLTPSVLPPGYLIEPLFTVAGQSAAGPSTDRSPRLGQRDTAVLATAGLERAERARSNLTARRRGPKNPSCQVGCVAAWRPPQWRNPSDPGGRVGGQEPSNTRQGPIPGVTQVGGPRMGQVGVVNPPPPRAPAGAGSAHDAALHDASILLQFPGASPCGQAQRACESELLVSQSVPGLYCSAGGSVGRGAGRGR
jgi:hypothetical protein